MSRKHAELERELIEDLEPRTGRTLTAWMAAIENVGLDDKNAIIDWLRPQGLTFAHASWLERIHNNGGRPIYLGTTGSGEVAASLPVPPAFEPRPAVPAAPPPRPAPLPTTVPAGPRLRAVPPAPAAIVTIEALLARGKGLRPLADMLLREIRHILPSADLSAAGDLVSIVNPVELAVLLIGPRELRLGLALGEAPSDAALARSRPTGAGQQITHTLVLTDARQVGTTFADLVRQADNHANSKA